MTATTRAPYQLRPLRPLDGVEPSHSATDFHNDTKALLDGPSLDNAVPYRDNMRRAAFAAEAIATYARRTGSDGESLHLAVSDLLSDLRHLLDLASGTDDDDGYGRTLAELVESSAMHYEAEIRGEL